MFGRISIVFLWIGMALFGFISVYGSPLDLEQLSDAIERNISQKLSIINGTSQCTCANVTRDIIHEKWCSCSCEGISEVPDNLSKIMCILSIFKGEMEILRASAFQRYRTTLRDINLFNMNRLRIIEPGTFHDLPYLRTIYISGATQLSTLDSNLFTEKILQLKTLRIVHSGLTEIPSLDGLQTKDILHTIIINKRSYWNECSSTKIMSVYNLESNHIKRIPSRKFRVRAEELLLSFNSIEEIESEAFHGSQVAKLILKGNQRLARLHPDSFSNLRSLRLLDLSMTSITFLPTKGLSDLEVLRLENTKALKVFPSVYNFEYIKEASLTYPYHCCAFQFPDTHSPKDYARHQEFLLKMQKACSEQNQILTQRRPLAIRASNVYSFPGSWGRVPESSNRTSFGFKDVETEEEFHEEATVTPLHAMCGNLSKNYRNVTCHPVPDAFNPCEDLMGNWALRIQVWIVAIFALLGNFAVLLVLISSRFRMTVPKFLMCNLAVADLCMGLYLLLIAIMDVRSIGVYFNFAIDWQSGWGCQIAGFLTVLSSELSIFTLAVITSERWYTITYAIHLNKRLKLRLAANIMACGWVYSLIMASLPLIGVSNYSRTSICLPLENKDTKDIGYLVTLLIFNGLAFWTICTCYGRMYCSIRKGQELAQTHSDMTVAKRMAMLVFTDFACWAPITFFGLTALAGYPLIDVPKTKILLVFFYPLNSCANPYLYALLTQQYQRDLFILLSKYGLCAERAARFKGPANITPKCNAVGSGCQTGGKDPSTNPSHRGSLLTTMTSLDNSNNCSTRHSMGTVREYRLATVELLPVNPECEQTNQNEQTERLSNSSFL